MQIKRVKRYSEGRTKNGYETGDVIRSNMKTVQEVRAASALELYHSDEQIQAFIARRDAVGWTEALLELPPADACWALTGWLSAERRVQWVQASARRAQEYAAHADDCGTASDYAALTAAHARASGASAYVAANAIDYAAAAATTAAYAVTTDYAYAYAARNAEYQLAIRHGASLLEQQLTSAWRTF